MECGRLMSADDQHNRFILTLEVVQTLLALITRREHEINILYERIESLQSGNKADNKDAISNWTNEVASAAGLQSVSRTLLEPPAGGVLIIDSLMPMRLKLREIITGGGFTIAGEVESLQEALKIMQNRSPDLIVIGDLDSTGRGLDLLRVMREINPDLKTIIITEFRKMKEMLTTVQHSSDVEIMSKPVNRLRLVEMVHSLLNRSSAFSGV